MSETAPAVLQMFSNIDGKTNAKMILASRDITFNNLYILGCDETGNQDTYQSIQMESDNLYCIIDGCIFERSNYAILG